MTEMTLTEYVARLAPTHKAAIELMKFRQLLYEAVMELQYVQDAEDHSQCASAKGRWIVEKGMELLNVPDLSAEQLTPVFIIPKVLP